MDDSACALFKWENVANDTDRLKIPEGYIYRVRAGTLGDPAMVFVPTPPKVVSIPNPPGGVMVRGDRQVARSVHVTPLDRDGKPEDLGRCNALGCNAPAINKLDGGWRFCALHTRENTDG